MSEFMMVLYLTGVGFAAAGVLGSFYQLITNQPPRFAFDQVGVFSAVSCGVLMVMAGPFILMRNAIRARLIEGRAVGWLAASCFFAAIWSCVSGAFVMHFALALSGF